MEVDRDIIWPGPLPAAWANPGAFPSLTSLNISANNLSGPLPPEWGANGTTFGRLQKLDLRENGLEGYLPDEWGPGFQVIAHSPFLDLAQCRLPCKCESCMDSRCMC